MPDIQAEEHQRTANLALARAVQQALLPQECPRCVGTTFAAKYRPAEHVGGDFYDLTHLGPEQVVLLIGDAVGHGIHSALVMALLLGHLRAHRPERLRPAQIIAEVNELLVDLGEKTDEILLCSLFYGVLDMPSRVLFYVDAGHPPPLCCRGTMVTSLTPNAMLLGAAQFQATEQCHQFEPGDRFVLYTDGIVEARDSGGQLYSVQRLEEALRGLSEHTAEQAIKSIFAEVESFSSEQGPEDDATIVILDFA